jgi:hypothetical protein
MTVIDKNMPKMIKRIPANFGTGTSYVENQPVE